MGDTVCYWEYSSSLLGGGGGGGGILLCHGAGKTELVVSWETVV